MSENVEAKVVESEELSIKEKEEQVQEKAGAVFEDGVYKVDLSKPPVTEQEEKNRRRCRSRTRNRGQCATRR